MQNHFYMRYTCVHEFPARHLETAAGIKCDSVGLRIEEDLLNPQVLAIYKRASSNALPTPSPRHSFNTAMRPIWPSGSRRAVPMPSPLRLCAKT